MTGSGSFLAVTDESWPRGKKVIATFNDSCREMTIVIIITKFDRRNHCYASFVRSGWSAIIYELVNPV